MYLFIILHNCTEQYKKKNSSREVVKQETNKFVSIPLYFQCLLHCHIRNARSSRIPIVRLRPIHIDNERILNGTISCSFDTIQCCLEWPWAQNAFEVKIQKNCNGMTKTPQQRTNTIFIVNIYLFLFYNLQINLLFLN